MKNKNTMIIGGVAVGVLLLLYLRRNNSSNDETLKSSGAGSSGGGGTGGGGGMFGGGGGGRPLPAETIVVNNTLRPLVMPRPLFARPQVSPIDSRPTTSPVSTIAPSVSPSVAPNIPNLPNIQAPLRSNFLTFDGRYSQSRGLDFGGIVE
jgi:hypothetical protein